MAIEMRHVATPLPVAHIADSTVHAHRRRSTG